MAATSIFVIPIMAFLLNILKIRRHVSLI